MGSGRVRLHPGRQCLEPGSDRGRREVRTHPDAGDSTVQLNGAGCAKAVFKVYTAGLYLEKKASTPQEVASQRGPKRLSITMLREIDSTELGKLFSRAWKTTWTAPRFRASCRACCA